jgi:hypothetical protein
MRSSFYRYTFPIDHILAEQHGGKSVLENLALACLHCNANKEPNIAGIDPDDGSLHPLFNPRRDIWREHFSWNGPLVVGRTPVGRATIAVLKLNDADYLSVRETLIAEGGFPGA